MSYLNRVWVAATVAVAQGHTDSGRKCKTAVGSIHQNRSRLFAGVVGSGVTGAMAGNPDAEDRLRQTDESLRKVMYMNCWGQG